MAVEHLHFSNLEIQNAGLPLELVADFLAARCAVYARLQSSDPKQRRSASPISGPLRQPAVIFKQCVGLRRCGPHGHAPARPLQARYPVRYMDDGRLQEALTRQAQNVLWSAQDYFLDALCVNIKQSEITISLPLLLHSSSWSAPLDASKVAHALFLSFFRGCGIGQLSRRKKEEVELQNELFVEAQCRSDRPGFAIVDPDDHQVFKLYNAMGLGHQHDDLRTLLARVRSAQLAVQWCRFLSQESPFKFRASQVKGDEEALNHWDWRGEVEKQNLASSPPLPSLSDWLLQNT